MEDTNSNKIDAYEKQKNKEDLKKHLVAFALMIVMTLLAFGIVASGVMSAMFAIPLLVILAATQVAFQFYYFMHMKDKGHQMPATMMYGGIWAALLALAALGVITWW